MMKKFPLSKFIFIMLSFEQKYSFNFFLYFYISHINYLLCLASSHVGHWEVTPSPTIFVRNYFLEILCMLHELLFLYAPNFVYPEFGSFSNNLENAPSGQNKSTAAMA